MKHKRREFLKQAAFTSLAAASGMLQGFSPGVEEKNNISSSPTRSKGFDGEHLSVIGLYGDWAAKLNEDSLPAFSFRLAEWKNIDKWRKTARKRVEERMFIPDIGPTPRVTVNKQYV